MTTEPDARPGTEGAGERLHPDAALIDAVAMQLDADLFVGRSSVETSRSAVAAIRAALLRDAPVVWVATDDDGSSYLFHEEPEKRGDLWRARFADVSMYLGDNLTPGTVRRYALVPHPEGEETPT